MALETPPKSGRLTLAMQNGGGRFNGVNSFGYGSLGRGAMKPGFFVSFMVDARGGKMHGKRHSGVDLIIPPSKVCMPTRITCKLVRKGKLIHPPVLKEGEELASRIAELGPVGEKFLGAVLIELPHFASRIDGERELVILRSDNGVSWYEHEPKTPSEALVKLIENEAEINKDKRVVQIFTDDFPRYFVAITRIRQVSKVVGSGGGMVKSSVSQAVATFPEGAIGKNIKVGLQILPVAPETALRVVGQKVGMSAVTTIEPRRRKFRSPVSVAIPVSKEMQDIIRKQKADENPAVHILYSITGGSAPSQWEDITGSAPLNLVNDAVSFSTIVSARYWLMDCRNLPIPIKAAGDIFQDVVAAPFLAKFYILAKQHSLTEAQVRVLCMTDDDIESTLERQEQFAIIGSTVDIEVFEGKPYYLDITGNFKPVAASGQELFITFHSFRVNRLSFVAHIIDASRPPTADLFLSKELVTSPGRNAEQPLFTLTASLPNFDAGLVSPDLEPDQWKAKLEAAKLSLAQDRPPVGAALRLTDIAEALQGDWVLLASPLGISHNEVVKIQTEFGSAPEQAILMLHLWVEKHGGRVTAIELERALRKIGRDDVVGHCIYDTSAEISTLSDDHDSLNPIDSSFVHQERSTVLENVPVSKAEIQTHPYVEVDEGVEYQVEEVWDGSQWHKTRIAVQKSEDSNGPSTQSDLATNGDDLKINSALPEKSEEGDIDFGPAGHLAAVKEEEITQSEILNTDDEPSLEVKATAQVLQTEQPSSEIPAQVENLEGAKLHSDIQSNLTTDNQPDPSSASPVDVADQPESTQHFVDDASAESQSVSNTSAEVPHSEPLTAVDTEVREPVDFSAAPTSETETNVKPDIKILSDVFVGEPKVTTEVEEFEETLPDGSVIKRQVTKTRQVTESFVVGSAGEFDVAGQPLLDNVSIENQSAPQLSEEDPHSQPFTTVEKTEVHGHEISNATFTDGPSGLDTFSNISIGDPKVTTEVEEFEETLPDGSIVKRKIIKTRQEQFSESFAVGGPDSAFDSINNEQVSYQAFDEDHSSSSPGTVVVETEEILEDGTVVKHKVTKTTEQHVETE